MVLSYRKGDFFILGFSLILHRAFSYAAALLMLDAFAWLLESRITFISVAEYEIYNFIILDFFVLIYLLRPRATHALAARTVEPNRVFLQCFFLSYQRLLVSEVS